MSDPSDARSPTRTGLPPHLLAALAAGVVVPPVAAWSILRWGRAQQARAVADALVLPGAKVYADGTASPAMARRVAGTAVAWHAGLAPRIVVTGAFGEAEAGRELLIAAGVDPRAILTEPTARSTAQNAARTAAVLGPQERVVVVTCDAHAARCAVLFGRAFAEVQLHTVTTPGTPWRFALREAAAVAALVARG